MQEYSAVLSMTKWTDPMGNAMSIIWPVYECVAFRCLITSFGLDFLAHDLREEDVDSICRACNTSRAPGVKERILL